MSAKIKFETTGNFRHGIAQKSQKPYWMADAYAHLENDPYPQKFSYYCASEAEMLQPGMYEGDAIPGVVDGRIEFRFDPRQARRISSPQPVKA